MKWLNYHHLFHFWAVMREGGVKAACEQLRLPPSTISAQVTKLEEILGGELFRRAGRDLEPTDLGHFVFRYPDQIFFLGREMMDRIRGSPMAGPISLKEGIVQAVPKLIAGRILEPALTLLEPISLVCYENKLERLVPERAVHNLDIVLSDSLLRKGLGIKVYHHSLGERSCVLWGPWAGKQAAAAVP